MLIESNLQPFMEADTIAKFFVERSYCRTVGTLKFFRPHPPIRAVLLGQHAEGCKNLQSIAAAAFVLLELDAFANARPHGFERAHFQAIDRVAIDERLFIERTAFLAQRIQLRNSFVRARNFFDAQIKWIQKEPATGVIRTGLLRQNRSRRAQRIDHHHAGASSRSPFADAPQIFQVADAPTGVRTQRVELQRPAPFAQIFGQETSLRRDDQPLRFSRMIDQLVITEGNIGGQFVATRQPATVFEMQLGKFCDGNFAALTNNQNRGFGRRVGTRAHYL